jgi:hypothetical protein
MRSLIFIRIIRSLTKKIAKFFKLKLYKGKINKQDLRDSLKKKPKKNLNF